MVQRSKEFGFTSEPSKPVYILGELLGQHLDRHFTPKLHISRTPHFTHTCFTQEREELVVACFGARFHILQ